ncbi:MAG: AGE family epimerase/isomerase [Gammaproteobacteria bacterium]|nr:AGE family epimerase/isomerase [Gammaproteobacteria bacterium]
MEILLTIVGVLVVTIIAVKLFAMKRRHKAASNLVFAKYTFNKLNMAQQNSVHDKAVEIVLASTATRMTGFANEVERYGWYALAMDLLGIHSAVPDNPCWYQIKNPYNAIIPGDSMIYHVIGALQQYDINVKISSEKGYPDKVTGKKEKKKGKKKSNV